MIFSDYLLRASSISSFYYKDYRAGSLPQSGKWIGFFFSILFSNRNKSFLLPKISINSFITPNGSSPRFSSTVISFTFIQYL